MSSPLRLPPGFRFGVATTAYQIEGAPEADGKGRSIWDTFAHTPGKTPNGDTGDVACDHYHRWPEDVRLMSRLGVDAYEFSVSWPRIQPDGTGPANEKGLDFYRRLVDALLERGITPCLTLYHWDLPQSLEDAGGWLVRDTAARFADYASLVHGALGDRVPMWVTINEPVVAAFYGYGFGLHAPGAVLVDDAFTVAHHLMLGHGLAVQAMRSDGLRGNVGIVHNLSPAFPASATEEDRRAADRFDATQNRTYTDAVLLGRYPQELPELYPGADLSVVRSGDLDVIGQPLDFLGVNYYFPAWLKAPGPGNPYDFELVPVEGGRRTSFGWPVVPEGMYRLLVGLRDRYGAALPPLFVTENGAAYDDVPDPDGRVHDPERVDFLTQHLAAVGRAAAEGVDVRGYFVWSLMDNFEWAEGYSKRFGLVYVDYATQRRTPKTSYEWYRQVIAAHR